MLIAELLSLHLRLYRENYPHTRSCQSSHQQLCLWQRWALGVAFPFLYVTLTVLDHSQAELEGVLAVLAHIACLSAVALVMLYKV